jgi:hypothetical protein
MAVWPARSWHTPSWCSAFYRFDNQFKTWASLRAVEQHGVRLLTFRTAPPDDATFAMTLSRLSRFVSHGLQFIHTNTCMKTRDRSGCCSAPFFRP